MSGGATPNGTPGFDPRNPRWQSCLVGCRPAAGIHRADCPNRTTPAERRSAYWSQFMAPDTEFENDPDDGHEHDWQHISPVSLGSFGPTHVACLACGWVKSWGEAARG